jgi:hypothetical protein
MASKTVDQVVAAIKALQDYKGSSRAAVLKYFKNELQIDNPALVAKALKGGLRCGLRREARSW